MKIKRLKGFRDVLTGEAGVWTKLEVAAAEVFSLYGFTEVRLPLLEETALFRRSIGEETDIVEKEMYSFEDTGGDAVTLRPEGTAGTVRAYMEAGLAHNAAKERWFYKGPMFRRERPQKGRFRQFHQIGAEMFGYKDPGADADVISLLWDYFVRLGLSARVSLEINSLGCAEDRARYVAELVAYLKPKAGELCDNCVRRIERNPLRVLDCKSPTCRAATLDAPGPAGSLCPECETHFESVKALLSARSVPFKVNPRMVRGLDYYNRTTFELLTGELGAQNAVAAGGRYDGLVASLGGPQVPALGFAVGVERLVLLLGEDSEKVASPLAYFVYRGEDGFAAAWGLRARLLAAGVRSDIDYEARSFKAQFRSADSSGARFALVIAEDEVASNSVTVKDLLSSEQVKLSADEAVIRLLAAASEVSR